MITTNLKKKYDLEKNSQQRQKKPKTHHEEQRLKQKRGKTKRRKSTAAKEVRQSVLSIPYFFGLQGFWGQPEGLNFPPS